MKNSLTLKINFVLLPAMLLLMAIAFIVVRHIADRTALEESKLTARLMMAAAQATFDYTVEQVKPSLEAKYDFLVQTVSSYAATETIGRMQREFHDYRYHVAALNPTNKRDQADAWETLAIQALARDGSGEFSAIRDSEKGKFAFIATPIRISNDACLTCHSVPDAAPHTMLDTYGRDNGFGWKLNEVVAVQVVSVPMSVAQLRADTLLQSVMYVLVASFVLIAVLVNGALYLIVTRRVGRLSSVADRISKGAVDSESIKTHGSDELSSLERAFERMRVSLSLAMKTPRSAAAADRPLHADVVTRLKARLAEQIGPMASLLVDRAAAGAVSQREFVVLLSEMIPASVPLTLWLKELDDSME